MSLRHRSFHSTSLPFLPLVALTVVAAAACGGDSTGSDSAASEWAATTDTVADTVFVRTTSGSVWGPDVRLVEELRIGQLDGPEEYAFGQIKGLAIAPDGRVYLVDGQVPALRVYGPDGAYLKTLYGEGGGPGEYSRPDGGIAFLPDGRLLLRDPANGRINVYDTAGVALDTWPISGNQFTSTPLFVDSAGRTAVYGFAFTDRGLDTWLTRYAPDGTRVDSLPAPNWDRQPAVLTASLQDGDNWSRSSEPVPFTPYGGWTFSPHGYFVAGFTDRYLIYLLREGPPVLAIGRVRDPVPVGGDERANQVEMVTGRMRAVDPKWQWEGPPIPDQKPAFQSMLVDLDGRVWVRLYTEAEPIPAEEREEGETFNRSKIPAARWRERPVYDVFEPDGRFMGTLALPVRAQLMQARGDRVWAIDRDELGVEYVVRYRIEASAPD